MLVARRTHWLEEVKKMTRKVIAILAGLALAACSKERPEKVGTSTTTGASDKERTATVEEVRMVMLAERPDATAAINALQITNANGVVTLRGHVDDEQAKKALIDRVKRMPGVKEVKDELAVLPARIKVEGAPAPQVQPGQPGHPGSSPTPASTHTPRTEAVRTQMSKDPKAQVVVNRLVITDDGSVIFISGTVPDQATHDAVMKQAKKAPGVSDVKDNVQIAK
jgi:osmotically-inducible protein OsmY